MPHRQCKICRQVVSAGEFRAHRLKHVREKRDRPGSEAWWRRLRELVIARDGGVCAVCGGTENLEVDHIDGNWRNNALKNLRTVCFECNPRGNQRARPLGGIS